MMILLHIATLVGFTLAIPKTPNFLLNQERSLDGSPSVSITFPDGYNDNLVLSKYSITGKKEDYKEHLCHYVGHLEKERSACVAMTGCPGLNDVTFTIMSEHSVGGKSFTWTKDGNVKIVKGVNEHPGFPKTRGVPVPREEDDEPFGAEDDDTEWIKSGDEVFNEEDEAIIAKIEKECEGGACDDEIQRSHVLEYHVFYERDLLKKMETEDKLIERVMGMMTHAQVHFCHDSLGSKIQLKLQDDGFTYVKDTKRKNNWKSRDKFLNKVSKLSRDFNTTADINIFLGWHGPMSTSWFTGIAWIGQVCQPREKNNNDYYKCQLTFMWDDPNGSGPMSDAWQGEVSFYKSPSLKSFSL